VQRKISFGPDGIQFLQYNESRSCDRADKHLTPLFRTDNLLDERDAHPLRPDTSSKEIYDNRR
jgi:hypothetical protein